MESKETLPNFKFSFAELMQLGDKGVQLIAQDTAILLNYGVDGAYKTGLEAKIQALKDFKTDEELEGAIKNLTEIKDQLADTVKVGIRSVMVRVKQVFAENTGNYARFGTKGMDQMNNVDLVKCGYRVVRLATEFLAQLAPKGLTQPMITALETAVKEFDTGYDAQQDAKRKRISVTSDRVKLGNEVYAMLTELFDYGKDYWVSRDAARYKDYIIYNTATALPPVSLETPGAIHGSIINSDTLAPVVNGLIFLEGIETPIEADEDGTYECDQIIAGVYNISATADDCNDYNGTVTIVAGEDVALEIMMETKTENPPNDPS
jgi:hypothetical protein